MDNSLPEYEAFRANLREQEIRERARGNLELAQEIVAALRVFAGFEEEIKLRYRRQEEKLKESETARPGVKPVILPKVDVPVSFVNDKPVPKLFLQHDFDKKITREKLTEWFGEFDVTGFKVHKMNLSRGTTKVSCKTLERACKFQCLALLKKFEWSYFCETKNRTYSGVIKISPDTSLVTVNAAVRKQYEEIP